VIDRGNPVAAMQPPHARGQLLYSLCNGRLGAALGCGGALGGPLGVSTTTPRSAANVASEAQGRAAKMAAASSARISTWASGCRSYRCGDCSFRGCCSCRTGCCSDWSDGAVERMCRPSSCSLSSSGSKDCYRYRGRRKNANRWSERPKSAKTLRDRLHRHPVQRLAPLSQWRLARAIEMNA
jgi:hypothetical protein